MQMMRDCGIIGPSDDVFIFLCGPKGYLSMTRDFLTKNGYEAEIHFN